MGSDRRDGPLAPWLATLRQYLRLFIALGLTTMIVSVMVAGLTGWNVYVLWALAWGVSGLGVTVWEARRVRS